MASSAWIAARLVGLDLEAIVLEEAGEGREGLVALASGQVGRADLVSGPVTARG